jgi:hypothetical protein
MDPNSKWGFRKSYRDARRRVKDVLRPPSAGPSPLAASTSGTRREVGNVAWVGLGIALEVLKETTDVFPPLKSAIGGFIACLDVLQVGTDDSNDG